MLKDYQIKLLMRAHEVEKTLGDIYTQFAENFPDHNDLWSALIKEEHEHAEAVRTLYQLTYEGKSLFDEGNIKAEAIQSIIDYLKGIYSAAKQGKYTARKAISITCDIEKSLIEKDFYSHFKVSPEYAEILQLLEKGAKVHLLLAQKTLDKL